MIRLGGRLFYFMVMGAASGAALGRRGPAFFFLRSPFRPLTKLLVSVLPVCSWCRSDFFRIRLIVL